MVGRDALNIYLKEIFNLYNMYFGEQQDYYWQYENVFDL